MMFSAPRFRLAASCAALTLGLLPRLAAAQSADTPFFAEDLTRARLGDIPNLDQQVASLARMAPDGHMIITGAETDVYVPSGKYVELLPKLKIVGFTPVALKVFEDRQETRTYGLEKTGELPTLRVDPPTGASNRKLVQVAVYDAQRNVRTLMQCILRARLAAPPVAVLAPKRRNEQCRLEIEERQTLSATFLYLGDIYMGRVGDGAGEVNLDERRLPPGKYNCQMVAQNTDGILLPGMSREYIVPSRYTIACADASPTISIPEHDPNAKLMVKVQHTPGLSITKTRVYIAGNFAGEKEGDEFTLGLPLQNVPTGVNTIEVIGVGPDDITYPVESIAVKIKNEPWEQRTFNTAEYLRIADNLPRIKEQERLVGYWLERADNEPDRVLVSSTLSQYHTYTEITDKYVPGNRAEYKANAKKAFILLTQLQLETGKLYHKLQMRTRAKNMLYRVMQELGTHTPDGVEAAAEHQTLKKERLTTL